MSIDLPITLLRAITALASTSRNDLLDRLFGLPVTNLFYFALLFHCMKLLREFLLERRVVVDNRLMDMNFIRRVDFSKFTMFPKTRFVQGTGIAVTFMTLHHQTYTYDAFGFNDNPTMFAC